MRRRLFAMLVGLCLVASLSTSVALAEDVAQDGAISTDTSGLCEHHTQHDESCGYTEGTPEQPCTHEHTDDCYVFTTACTHTHTAECYSDGILPAEGEEKAADACSHQCSEESGCITRTLDCKHEHDAACGYAPATEGTPCTFVCEICNAQEEGGGRSSSSQCATGRSNSSI